METEQIKKEPPKILIVDDLNVNVSILKNIVKAEGYTPLGALSVQKALDIMNDTMPQLILSDFSMPEMDGLEFCRLLKSNPITREIPFIFITVADSIEEKREAFEAGAEDYITKPFERFEVIMRINNQLNSYRIKQEMKNYNRMMHKMMTEQKKQIEKERENVLLALTKVMERRNVYLGHHLERVGDNCRILAQSLQLVPKFENYISDSFVETIGTASRLHDIGNIMLPDTIIYKNTMSEKEKREFVKHHTEAGAGILQEINQDSVASHFLDMAVVIAKYHHANWDGNGYPGGVRGEEIPLAARITTVINDFDALMAGIHCDRPHTVEESIDIINERSGTLYDPGIVGVFNKVVRQLQTD